MLSAERIALLKHGAPPRNALEAALRNAWYGGGASYKKTVGPAPIISISDAKPKPAKSLIVGMEPVQDLHGYDSPWPAGGGANLIPENGEGWYSPYGNISSTFADGVWTVTNTHTGGRSARLNIGTLAAGTYYAALKAITNSSGTSVVVKATADDSTIKNIVADSTPDPFTLAQDTECYITVGSFNAGTGTITYLWLSKTNSGYSPYSNICPISGRTGVTVNHSGADTSDPQTYPVVFPDSVGTVYGGTVDPVSGVLTVTGILEQFNIVDGNNLVSQINSISRMGNNVSTIGDVTRISFDIRTSVDQTIYNRISSSYADDERMCNMARHYFAYNDSTTHWYRNTILYVFLPTALVGSTNESVYDYLVSIKDTNPLSLYVPLATPITYQLTPTQIQLLKGENVLWSDGDSLTLTYLGTTPPNLLGGMLGGGLGGAQEPTEETSEEPVEKPVSDEPTKGEGE